MFHDAPCEAAVTVHRKRTAKSAQTDVLTRYRLRDVVDFLVTQPHPFLKVALQFPDELLDDAVPIVRELETLLQADSRTVAMEQRRTEHLAGAVPTPASGDAPSASAAVAAAAPASPPPAARASAPRPITNTTALDNPNAPTKMRFTVLADNTFGSCCPDEITAQHYANECIIHFGEACLSRNTRIPVFYVFPTFHLRCAQTLVLPADAEKAAKEPDLTLLCEAMELANIEEIVHAQYETLARHAAHWRADHPTGPAVPSQLVVVGAPEAQPLLVKVEASWRASQPQDPASDVTVAWCSYRNSTALASSPTASPSCSCACSGAAPPTPSGAGTTTEAGCCRDGGCQCAGATPSPLSPPPPTDVTPTWPLDWSVNGVFFPRFISAVERAHRGQEELANTHGGVQFFLFVGPSNAPHLVHLSAVQQYNNFHYNDAQREFLEQVTDADSDELSGMQVISAVDENSGVATLHQTDAISWIQAGDVTMSSVPAVAHRFFRFAMARDRRATASEGDNEKTDGRDDAKRRYSGLDLKRLYTAACGAAHILYQRRLRQRDFNIETLRDSNAVGILVASLAIDGYYETTMLLHKLLRASGKRSYIIYVGHLNEFKLANFVDTVDCFVAIACPNSRESYFPLKTDNYLKPVVAPSEVLLAFAARDESSPLYGLPAAYSTAFDYAMGPLAASLREATEAAAAAAAGGETRKTSEEEDWGATGTLVRAGGTSRALMTQDAAVQGSLARMHERSYVGLDPQIGQTAVQTEIVDGLHGIARGYADERSRQ